MGGLISRNMTQPTICNTGGEAGDELIYQLPERHRGGCLYRQFVVDEVAVGEGAVAEHVCVAVLGDDVVHVLQEEFQELVESVLHVHFQL